MAQFTDIVLSYFSCAAQKKNKTVYCDIQKIKDCAATSVFLFKNFTLDMCFFFFLNTLIPYQKLLQHGVLPIQTKRAVCDCLQ